MLMWHLLSVTEVGTQVLTQVLEAFLILFDIYLNKCDTQSVNPNQKFISESFLGSVITEMGKECKDPGLGGIIWPLRPETPCISFFNALFLPPIMHCTWGFLTACLGGYPPRCDAAWEEERKYVKKRDGKPSAATRWNFIESPEFRQNGNKHL